MSNKEEVEEEVKVMKAILVKSVEMKVVRRKSIWLCR